MLKIHDTEQGTDEWHALRCGLLTASEIKLILSPTLKVAKNDKSRAHVFEIAAQRISQRVEPFYISDDMMRGHELEDVAIEAYEEHFNKVNRVGFMTNNRWGFTLGYSPDGLVGDDGLIEVKAPRQKQHVKNLLAGEVPDEYVLQCQTGLLVSGRKWLDFISYHDGLLMKPVRVKPDPTIQQAIIGAACEFEAQVSECVDTYKKLAKTKGAIKTEQITRLEDVTE